MIKELTCLTCNRTVSYNTHGRPIARYCSRKCSGTAGSKKYFESAFTWNKATKEEAMNRLIKNYNERIIKTDSCWEWNGVIANTGYGALKYKGKIVGVHRLSWLIHKGEIPPGDFVLHHCDNRKCSNPDHLFLGTPKDNTQDMLKKNRNRHCNQLSKNAKLTRDKAKIIKKLLEDGISQFAIAREYGVSRGTIQDIHRRKTWKDV